MCPELGSIMIQIGVIPNLLEHYDEGNANQCLLLCMWFDSFVPSTVGWSAGGIQLRSFFSDIFIFYKPTHQKWKNLYIYSTFYILVNYITIGH